MVLVVDRITPLAEVTFCVLDLETTGTSDDTDEIVEVGAVLVRGGEVLGRFQTMVRHPSATGSSSVPSLASVLASLLEFMRGAVVVGHNIRFDLRFLNAALWKTDRDVALVPEDAIDTMPLARRLLRDDADDCRLGTLAQRFEFQCRPTHRALADAMATVELLHLLIERATHYGAFDLDDLMRLPGLMRHPFRSKLATTVHLARTPGVARLLDRNGQSMYVVAADDLRHAVRRLFDRDDQHDQPPVAVLRHLHRIVSVHAAHPIVANVIALRWSSQVPQAGGVVPAYLQHVNRSGRLRVVADRFATGLVAGPLPRPLARRVVSALAARPVDETVQFVASLSSIDVVALPCADDAVLRDVVRSQRALAVARAFSGVVHVDGVDVTIDNGRVRDVCVDGRSAADQLPAVIDDEWRDCAPTVAHAAEAMFVHALLVTVQPGCEILDS